MVVLPAASVADAVRAPTPNSPSSVHATFGQLTAPPPSSEQVRVIVSARYHPAAFAVPVRAALSVGGV